MAVKLTKRKGFNFYRSYYDVYNELEDKDKVAFIDALLDRQFLGKKPINLEGMAKFAYISQTNAIDSQVKGYEDKTGVKLNESPPCVGVKNKELHPSEQEELQGELQEKEEYTYVVSDFLIDWNELRTKHLKKPSFVKSLPHHDKNEFSKLTKDYSREDFKNALKGLFNQEVMPNGNTTMQTNPSHFLNFFNSYFSAYHDRNKNLYGKKDKTPSL